MKNKEAKLVLIREYGNLCMLGGIVYKKNPLTVHHLIPQRVKIINQLYNLSLVARLQHDMFNAIECENQSKANEINEYLRYFKESKDMLAREQMKKYVEEETKRMGYEVEERGKILKLKRR